MEPIVNTDQMMPIQTEEAERAAHPDKEDYKQRMLALSPEDKAFMDGYLFAKVTEAAKKGA